MDFLILVNKENHLDSDYIPYNLIELHEPTGKKVDSTYVNRLNQTAYNFFKVMQLAAKKEGLEIFIDSSYRSYEYQMRVFHETVKEKGLEHANKYCAIPGSSEHQTGLAIDIIARRNGVMIEESYENDLEMIWMRNNSYKYGYILRYPKGKENITGYNFEPWHFRFVGVDVSNFMHDNNISTLEEYHILSKSTTFYKKRIL